MLKCKHCKKLFKEGNGKGSLKRHHAANKAANKKKSSSPKKFKSSPSKIKRSHEEVDWTTAGRLSWITRRRNIEAKEVYEKEYKDLSKNMQSKIDDRCERKYSDWGQTKEEKKSPRGKTRGKTDRKAAEEKAYATGMLATVLTKEKIRKSGKRWQLVEFTGPEGRESTGIVDLLAIRKDHRQNTGFNPGDLFEIIIIQIKGGNPPKRPTKEEIVRMKIVAEEYYAKNIILAEWKPGEKLRFYQLKKNFNQKTNLDSTWTSAEPSQIFR